jgi:ubiquinol-cytochrome c reductase iron-sulfur subunit
VLCLLLQASADVLAMAALEVDLSTIKEGNCVTVKWRGKPVFVKHRTDVEVAREQAVPVSELRDPESDADRVQDPKVGFILPHFVRVLCIFIWLMLHMLISLQCMFACSITGHR